jgi:hypothetical protein
LFYLLFKACYHSALKVKNNSCLRPSALPLPSGAKESENENENEEINPVGVTDWVQIFVNNPVAELLRGTMWQKYTFHFYYAT